MKKLLALSALVGVLAVQQCFAATITVNVNRHAGYFSGSGGEFTITSVAPSSTFDNLFNQYAAVATYDGGFQTFCASTAVGIRSNPLTATTDPTGVAAGTGWLYNQFAHGTLGGYDYTPGAGRESSAYALQAAIWYLQGMPLSSIDHYVPGFDPNNNAFVGAARVQFGSDAAAMVASDQYGVDRLLMTNPDNGRSQPMLTLSPVPDGGLTVGLLGLALVGLAGLRRTIRA